MTRPVAGPSRDYHFPKFEIRSLSNGLRLIVAPVHKLPVVTVLAVVDATAVSEPAGKEGVAELTAKALREGTTEIDGAHLTLEFEKLGTSLEAGADWDSTVASMTVIRDKIEPAFALFATVLTSPAFRDDDIERLRAERLAERLQVIDEPRGLADEAFSRFVYSDSSRFAEPMSGSTRSVGGITRDDVAAFYDNHYSPAGTTLIMVGDLTADDAEQIVRDALASWSGNGSMAVVAADAAARSSRAVQIVSKPEAAQSELRLGHVGVPRTHPDYFAIVVMNAVLGGLFSSRINLNLREAHGYTYGASSYYDWRRQAGPFVVSTAVQSEVTAEAIAEVLKEIDRMRSEEIGEDELTLATNYLEGVFPIRYETTAAIASALANMVIFELPETYYDTYRSNIGAVTTSDVLTAAKSHVQPESLQIVVVGNPSVLEGPITALDAGPLTLRDPADA